MDAIWQRKHSKLVWRRLKYNFAWLQGKNKKMFTFIPLTVNWNINTLNHSYCFWAYITYSVLFFFAGLARFFHNGEELRKDSISLSIYKILKILSWFESQKQLNFYASSLLFVYEGSFHKTNTKYRSKALTGPKHRQAKQENKSTAYSTSLKLKSSCGQDCSSFIDVIYPKKANGFEPYSLHHQAKEMAADMEPQTNTSAEGKSSDREKEENVEVRMIDFAHVFPSDRSDDGYIYGLRSLLFFLEQILQDWC